MIHFKVLWSNYHLVECGQCFSVVPDHPDSKLHHVRWHEKQEELHQERIAEAQKQRDLEFAKALMELVKKMSGD